MSKLRSRLGSRRGPKGMAHSDGHRARGADGSRLYFLRDEGRPGLTPVEIPQGGIRAFSSCSVSVVGFGANPSDRPVATSRCAGHVSLAGIPAGSEPLVVVGVGNG